MESLYEQEMVNNQLFQIGTEIEIIIIMSLEKLIFPLSTVLVIQLDIR